MAHPFLVAAAAGLAARGLDAVTFNFPYMERRAGAGPRAAARGLLSRLIATLADRGWLGRPPTRHRRQVDGRPDGDDGRRRGGRRHRAGAHPLARRRGARLSPASARAPETAARRALRHPADAAAGRAGDARRLRPSGRARAAPRPARRRSRRSTDRARRSHSFKVTGLPRGTQATVLEGHPRHRCRVGPERALAPAAGMSL